MIKYYLYIKIVKMISIYGLANPKTCEIRYIGITKNSLSRRFTKHLEDCKYARNPTHKTRWMCSLLEQDIIPVIKLIGKVETKEEAKKIENSLIAEHKTKRKLTNHEDLFTEDGIRKRVSKQTKAILSEKVKEYFKTNKHVSCKKLKVYDLNANLIGEYESGKEAAGILNISNSAISACIQGKIRQSKGYIFKPADHEDIVTPIIKVKKKYESKQRVEIYDTWKEKSDIFESFGEAAEFLGMSPGTFTHHRNSKKENHIVRYRYKIILSGK